MTSTRRVVTGQHNGQSIIVADEVRPGVALKSVPGFHFCEIWTTEGTARHPASPVHKSSHGWLPPPGGTQLQIVIFPPDSTFLSESFDPVAAAEEQRRLFPGVASHFDPEHPGMHATPTIDYAILLQGHIDLELESGDVVSLSPGDVVVQNGARHAWKNRSSEPAKMAFVLIGVHAANDEKSIFNSTIKPQK